MTEQRAELAIEQQLRKDIQHAQRAHDQLKLDTLRMAIGAIHNLEVARTDRKHPEHGQALTEADGLRVLWRTGTPWTKTRISRFAALAA